MASTFMLNIDVYSGVLPLGHPSTAGLEFEMSQLQQRQPPTAAFRDVYPRVIHLEHRAQEDFLIGESGESDGEKVVAVAHVTRQPDGKLKIKFSELGRPPAYEGATELVIGPGETRVLQLPAIATDKGDGTLRTVMVIKTLVK